MADYTATRWYAYYLDGRKFEGGTGVSLDTPIENVDPAQLKQFSVTSNTFSHTYRRDTNSWWKRDGGGNSTFPNYAYPTTYEMPIGTLTVDYDAAARLLVLSMNYKQ